MKKNNKSQQELTEELAQLRQQVGDLQAERLLWQQLNQESLRESEIKFSTLAETTAAAIFIYQDNRNCYVNLATETITGYSRDELLQMNFWEVIHPDSRDFIREQGQARQRGEAVPARYEVKILSKDGTARWLDFTGGLIEFQGRPAVLGTAFDITERKQVEEERERLLAAEREQRLLAETLREVYLALAALTNPEAVLDEILGQMQRLVPYNTAHISLVEGDYWRIVRWQGYQEVGSEELVAYFQQPLANFPLLEKMVHSCQPVLISNTAESPDWIFLEKSDWIKSHIGVPICSQNRVLGFIQIDGDAPHKFSEADVGLSAALTHEINNPLQSMRTHLDLMLDFDLEPGEDKKFLRIMRQEVERLSEITRRILNLARPWPVSRRKVSIDQILSCRDLIQTGWGYSTNEREAQNIIRPHICRLRRKINNLFPNSTLLHTVRKRGYLLLNSALI